MTRLTRLGISAFFSYQNNTRKKKIEHTMVDFGDFITANSYVLSCNLCLMGRYLTILVKSIQSVP